MDFIRHTIALALANVEAAGRPFACIIVKDGEILAEGVNQVAQTHDPTAHAEIVAIRKASATLASENFSGCDFYIYRDAACAARQEPRTPEIADRRFDFK